MKRSAIRCLVMVLALVVLAAPVAASERLEPRGGRVESVRIIDNAFRPRSLSIARGTVVRWANQGDRSHTTTSNANGWDSGTLAPGETFRHRFRRTGTFRYHCTIHPEMTARITVT